MANANPSYPMQLAGQASQFGNAIKRWDSMARWVFQTENHFVNYARTQIVDGGDRWYRRVHGAVDTIKHEPASFISGDGQAFNMQREIRPDEEELISMEVIDQINEDIIDYPYQSQQFLNRIRSVMRVVDSRVARMVLRGARTAAQQNGKFPGGSRAQVGADTAGGGGGFAATRDAIRTAIPRNINGATLLVNAIDELAEKLTNNSIPEAMRVLWVPPYIRSVMSLHDGFVKTTYKAPAGNNFVEREILRFRGFTIMEVPEEAEGGLGVGTGVFPNKNYTDVARSGRDYNVDARGVVGIAMAEPSAVEAIFYGGMIRSQPPIYDPNRRAWMFGAATHMGCDPIMWEGCGELFVNLV